MHNRSSVLTRWGQALPTPILLAPEDDWQFFIDYRQLPPLCGEQFESQAGQKARPVTDSATERSQRIGRLAGYDRLGSQPRPDPPGRTQ